MPLFDDIPELDPDTRRQLAEQVGCTFDGCDTGDDIWLTIEGEAGTAVLCETHVKLMAELGDDYPADRVGYVVDLGTVSLN